MHILSYTELRSNLKAILDQTIDHHERVIITRPGGEHVVMMPLKDYEAERETQYLLSTEANRQHLARSLEQANTGKTLQKGLLELF